jgi:putative transposase
MNELKNGGANDLLIAVVDGLKGFPDAFNAVFPLAQIQTCIVHLIRHSIGFASWKERKPVAAALKEVYRAKDAETARQEVEDFDAGPWGQKPQTRSRRTMQRPGRTNQINADGLTG